MLTSKADYVRSQGQTRNHHCHWPGCDKQVPPAMWGCKGHWFTLPANLRAKVWATYRPGQEVDGTPSAAYLKVAGEVQSWIAACAWRARLMGRRVAVAEFTQKRGWNDHSARQRLGTVRREIARRLTEAMERGWLLAVPQDSTSKRCCTMNSKMLARLYAEREALERFLLRDPDAPAGGVALPDRVTPAYSCAKAAQQKGRCAQWCGDHGTCLRSQQ